MKKNKTTERIFTVLFMFITTFLCISAVASVYLSTKDLVAGNEALFLRKAVLRTAGVKLPETNSETADLYEAGVTELTNKQHKADIFVVRDIQDSQIIAYVFLRQGPGLWGTITATVGLNPDMTELTGVFFTDQNETPGLGARISEEWFYTQFRGKTGPFTRVEENTKSNVPTEFDAITGATVTSKGVQLILNKTLEDSPALMDEIKKRSASKETE